MGSPTIVQPASISSASHRVEALDENREEMLKRNEKETQEEVSGDFGSNDSSPNKKPKLEENLPSLSQWKPIDYNGGIRFEVTGLPMSNFCRFVEANSEKDVVRFFKEILRELEDKRGLVDYHLKIRNQKDQFVVEVFYGEEREGPAMISPGSCISCFAEASLYPGTGTLITAGECILPEFKDQAHVQCSVDAKARAGFVITPLRHVERMADLEDDELFALWSVAVRALRNDSLPFKSMILNHGTYRNTPHLHLKVWVDDELHKQVRLKWSPQKINLWNRLRAMVNTAPKRPSRFFRDKGYRHGAAC